MTDEIRCKHCKDEQGNRVPLTRDRWENGIPKAQQTADWREGTVTLHEMWSCPKCKSTWLMNGKTRPMTPREAHELDIMIARYGAT